MEEPRIVYAVTSSDYDWWNLDGLFERQEDADAAVAAGFGQTVEAKRLYPAGFIPTRIDYWEATAEVTAKGSLVVIDWPVGHRLTIQTALRVEWTGGDFDPPTTPKVDTERTSKGGTWISAVAMTEDVARQACADAVASLLADSASA